MEAVTGADLTVPYTCPLFRKKKSGWFRRSRKLTEAEIASIKPGSCMRHVPRKKEGGWFRRRSKNASQDLDDDAHTGDISLEQKASSSTYKDTMVAVKETVTKTYVQPFTPKPHKTRCRWVRSLQSFRRMRKAQDMHYDVQTEQATMTQDRAHPTSKEPVVDELDFMLDAYDTSMIPVSPKKKDQTSRETSKKTKRAVGDNVQSIPGRRRFPFSIQENRGTEEERSMVPTLPMV
jgi:hypothetical protein